MLAGRRGRGLGGAVVKSSRRNRPRRKTGADPMCIARKSLRAVALAARLAWDPEGERATLPAGGTVSLEGLLGEGPLVVLRAVVLGVPALLAVPPAKAGRYLARAARTEAAAVQEERARWN